MKANALRDADGIWHDVSKTPATDPTKGSKAGRQAVVLEQGALVARRLDALGGNQDQLTPVWRNGELLIRHDFEQIRQFSEA
jgi:nicotinamide phosphoribosyltransferase